MSEHALSFGEAITTRELLHRDLGRLTIEEKNGLGERNRFVRKYDWVPHWKAELTVALRGLPIQMQIIEGMPEPEAPAASTYGNAIEYWNQAGQAIYDLDQADPDGDHIPTPDIIRDSFAARAAMARFSLAHYQLDNFSWHPTMRDRTLREANRRNEARLLTTAQGLRDASDDRLYAGWLLARMSEGRRLRFWERELFKVQNHPLVNQIQEKNRQKPRFLNKG